MVIVDGGLYEKASISNDIEINLIVNFILNIKKAPYRRGAIFI